MSRLEGERRPVPDPPKRDDMAGTPPSAPSRPEASPEAGTRDGEGGSGDSRGGPATSDDRGGSEVM